VTENRTHSAFRAPLDHAERVPCCGTQYGYVLGCAAAVTTAELVEEIGSSRLRDPGLHSAGIDAELLGELVLRHRDDAAVRHPRCEDQQ
jgi:hypothetical protein